MSKISLILGQDIPGVGWMNGAGIPLLSRCSEHPHLLRKLLSQCWLTRAGTGLISLAPSKCHQLALYLLFHISFCHGFPSSLPKIGRSALKHECPGSHLCKGVVRNECWPHPSSVPFQELLAQAVLVVCLGLFCELNLQATFCVQTSKVKPMFMHWWGLKQSESKCTTSRRQVGRGCGMLWSETESEQIAEPGVGDTDHILESGLAERRGRRVTQLAHQSCTGAGLEL